MESSKKQQSNRPGGSSSKSGGRRWGRGSLRNRSFRRNRTEDRPKPICPLCGQKINMLSTAISVTENQVPGHFECVIRYIAETENPKANEKIVYLGKGEFGIVKFTGGGKDSKFKIRKRITFEKSDEPIAWRREISKNLKQ